MVIVFSTSRIHRPFSLLVMVSGLCLNLVSCLTKYERELSFKLDGAVVVFPRLFVGYAPEGPHYEWWWR